MNQNTHAIEQIKKDIKKVRLAGRAAFIFGWVLLIAAAAAIWPLNNKYLILGLFSLLFLLGLFYIYSGQYIRVGKGDRTRSLLKTNGVLALPLCLVVLPVYICVLSFRNAVRFNNFPQQIKDIYNKPKRLGLNWWQILLLALIVILSVGSLFMKLKKVEDDTASKPAGQVQPIKVDTAAKSGFTINWPADYSATDLTKEVSGDMVPYTAYVGPKQTAEVYTVYAYDYPSKNFHFDTMTDKQLASANHSLMFNTVNDLHGKKLKSQPSTFMTYPSEDGDFSSQTLSGTLTGYIRTFYIGNRGYAVVTVGADQAGFISFANSFQSK